MTTLTKPIIPQETQLPSPVLNEQGTISREQLQETKNILESSKRLIENLRDDLQASEKERSHYESLAKANEMELAHLREELRNLRKTNEDLGNEVEALRVAMKFFRHRYYNTLADYNSILGQLHLGIPKWLYRIFRKRAISTELHAFQQYQKETRRLNKAVKIKTPLYGETA